VGRGFTPAQNGWRFISLMDRLLYSMFCDYNNLVFRLRTEMSLNTDSVVRNVTALQLLLNTLTHYYKSIRSALSPSLIVSPTRLSTVDDRAFPVAAARIWNNLPQHVHITSAPSLLVFRSRLETHLLLFPIPVHYRVQCSARAVTLPILDTGKKLKTVCSK